MCAKYVELKKYVFPEHAVAWEWKRGIFLLATYTLAILGIRFVNERGNPGAVQVIPEYVESGSPSTEPYRLEPGKYLEVRTLIPIPPLNLYPFYLYVLFEEPGVYRLTVSYGHYVGGGGSLEFVEDGRLELRVSVEEAPAPTPEVEEEEARVRYSRLGLFAGLLLATGALLVPILARD